MQVGYAKIHSRILESSVWSESPEVCKVWITLLAMAGPDGSVDAPPPAIAKVAALDITTTVRALERLAEPDKYSRSTDEEGRRILLCEDEGERYVHIVNYGKYRDYQTKEQARDAARKRKERRERKKKQIVKGNSDASRTSTDVQGRPRMSADTAYASASALTSTSGSLKHSSEDSGSALTSSAPENISLPKKKKSNGVKLTTRARKKIPGKRESKSGATWDAYSQEYLARYGVRPVRDAATNTSLCKLIDTVGAEEAPSVARFYIGHNSRWYVTKGHDPAYLAKDAKKLRTEWATNRKVTSGDARNAEKIDDMRAQSDRVQRLIDKRRESKK